MPLSLGLALLFFHRWPDSRDLLWATCHCELASLWKTLLLALLVTRRTCLFLVHLRLCAVCSPLVLFHRKLVSSMSHRFFLPRHYQARGTLWGVATGLGQPQAGWLGSCTGLGIKHEGPPQERSSTRQVCVPSLSRHSDSKDIGQKNIRCKN